MTLKQSLAKKKATIIERWLKLIMESYPATTSKFLIQEKDRFANPAGYTFSKEIEIIYEELLQEMNIDKLSTCLDNIIKIRSVQDYTPSEAVVFIFLLKKAIREELASEITERQAFEELLKYESKIDIIVQLTLDIYMKCRDKVSEIRMKEMKNEREMAFKILERISAIYEDPANEEGIKDRIN